MRRKNFSRRWGYTATAFLIILSSFTACNADKKITVIVREQGSGTREAFDTVIGDGQGNFLQMQVDGKKKYFTKKDVIVLTKTDHIKSSVARDKNAIGYISLGVLDETVKLVRVNGVAPTEETVLSGEYPLQRPYVIMTSETQPLTPVTEDFLHYLQSERLLEYARASACIFLSDPQKRGGEDEPIPVSPWERSAELPIGGKIVVRGSTSVQELFDRAMKGYADEYGIDAGRLFDYGYEGSSVGVKAVESDKTGNVIGLSSARVEKDGIRAFNACLDAVAVIVNKNNGAVENMSVETLYGVYTGRIERFGDIR